MKVFKVIYKKIYPGAQNDIRTAYVLAKDFKDAQDKVERNEEREFEGAHVKNIQLLEDTNIFV